MPGFPTCSARATAVTGSGGQVAPQQEECTCKSLLGSSPERNVVARVGATFAVQLNGFATVSLVLLD
jgi:hypothetical protein